MPEQNATLLRAVTTLTDEVSGLKRKIDTLETKIDETKEIVEAWGAMKSFGKFIKWLGAVAAAVTAIAIGVKLGITHMIGK